MIAAREAWVEELSRIDPSRLVFLDEAGANTDLVREHGWALRGERLSGAKPAGRWSSTTVISAIRREGPGALMIFEGATDATLFRTYVQEVLAPTLRPGEIVVMDNLASHRAAGVAEAIEAAGAEAWYLPVYSPDLNPIEKMWSKVKQHLRSAAARSTQALWDTICQALQTVTASDARGWFEACGYRNTEM